MADFGRGQVGPVEAVAEAGLAEVLAAYVAYGGQLAGSRRSSDNPLMLTHVRWVGPAGQALGASRRPNDELTMTAELRDAWVQLALHYPSTATPVASGGGAPWVPVDLDRGQARQLGARITRSHPSGAGMAGWPSGPSLPPELPGASRGSYAPGATGTYAPAGGLPYVPPPIPALEALARLPDMPHPGASVSGAPVAGASVSGAPAGSFAAPTGAAAGGAPGYDASGGGPGFGAPAFSAPAFSTPSFDPLATPPGTGAPSQTTGSWALGGIQELEIVPCVEVELPPAMSDGSTDEYAREYARDVAVHFARAARTIPQVRDLRAWMRGDRLVLAARMVLGAGSRQLTQAEMQAAARLLADALAARMLPYAQLAYADPLEWQAGTPLPE